MRLLWAGIELNKKDSLPISHFSPRRPGLQMHVAAPVRSPIHVELIGQLSAHVCSAAGQPSLDPVADCSPTSPIWRSYI